MARNPSVRRHRSMGIGTGVLMVAVIVGTAACGSPSSSAPTSTAATGTSSSSGPSSVSTASTSSRGVTKTASTWSSRWCPSTRWPDRRDSPQDAEFGEQTKAIKLFVKQINDTGGINGRKINPIITSFDPTNESEMRALCKTWTEGSPAAFAVLDGIGDWTGDNELCITQEGHTPFIGAWTTVTNWTNQGSPYLWWTGTGPGRHPSGGGQLGTQRPPDRRNDQGGDHRRQPGLGPGGPRRLSPSRPAQGRHHPGGQDHRRRPRRHGHHRRRGPAGHPAAPQCRRHFGHPAHPLQRLLPGAPGRDRPAVLPQAPPERLRGEHRVVARPPARPLRQGPQRPGGGDHRDPRWHRRPPSRRARGATTPASAAAGSSGTRPIPRSHRAT